ncbi:hypothetical protein R455_004376 [Salmonella enterica subsp. enterica]|nr:hypothetical protein [Salmonella enterica subsp. enterica serovar Wandsworth]EDT6629860.1 hypothetical protein [Salmonella enterica subsp. enterica serovar Wandsworth]EDT6699043.1 hypothetical protein [Salmonella enterica subsp. enterica serovar Wandsworth]EDT6703252.1 hypothetical protein [Salmonella enterica subsp. enterica serovar Wandsworth]EDT6712808.1 hypothetical protein [Salmonella enterica subsp. enterica serovar Wandsworth]
MLDNRTASAIDLALQKHYTPVGDLYAAIRHWRMKRCFSRDTAIRWLAHFLTSHSFTRSGFKQRHPDFLVEQDHGEQVWRHGETTDAYHRAHQRTIRRLRLILARKREIQKWNEKYDEWAVRWDELMKQKPY